MINTEKWLYQENSISQQFFLLYILGNTIFTIFYVNHAVVDHNLGLFIMLNIFLSLGSFLIAVRQKIYRMSWGYVGIAIAVFQLIRLMWIPEEIIGLMRFVIQALLVFTSLSALIGSIICIKRANERQKYVIEHKVDLVLLEN